MSVKSWFAKKLSNAPPLGLLPLPRDERDFDLGFLWGDDVYTPKQERNILKTKSVKLQKFNTCGWTSSTAAKEIDEDVILSMRSMVCQGRESGLISKDGFSNLRSNELVLQKFGIAEESLLPSDVVVGWDEYSGAFNLSSTVRANMTKHKTNTFWAVSSVNQILKAIDDGRTIKVGLAWFTGYNMSGGLKAPWILEEGAGYFVGAHALFIKGYVLNYHGQKVVVLQNSYGTYYADAGTFYVKFDHLMKNVNTYGAFVNLDMPVDAAKWAIANDGKCYKLKNDPKVYLLKSGKKFWFPDLATLYAHGFSDVDICFDDEGNLENVESGGQMSFWDGEMVKEIKTIIQQKDNLKSIFEKYFKEVFNH